MARREIKKIIEKAIKELQKEKVFPGFNIPNLNISSPEDKIHGDYATNAAMVICRLAKRSPMEIAENLKSQISNLKSKIFEKIEVAPPGFINFFLTNEYLQKKVGEILKKKNTFGNLKIGKKKSVQVEFISANPTGPFTVGNARGGFWGDVLANLFKKAGYVSEKAYYINDYGMQIEALGHSVLNDEQAKYKGEYIDRLNKEVKEKDPYRAGQAAAKIIINTIIKKTVKRMGIVYDEWFPESRLYKKGSIKNVLKILEKNKFLYQKDGAVWFASSKFGDERDRVVIKKDGLNTYLAGDIAYHYYKFHDKKFSKVINIWGADHAGDAPGLRSAVEALGYKDKLDIILLQFVTLFKGNEKMRMSKRSGVFVTMDDLLSEVSLDVVRFFFLQKSANTHLNFDISLAKESSEKNPVYYIQYAYARICSILAKSKIKNQKSKLQFKNQNLNLLAHPSELELIKQLTRLPEIIEDTITDYQVQRLPQYAMALSAAFHRFYRDCRVISEDRDLTKARLSLVSATKIVSKETLGLMGISAPEKM